MTPDNSHAPRKTLLIVSGFDGTIEEEYFGRAAPALERGYNTLLFAGHGQMDTLRFYPDTHFIPDFETPVSSVLDECLAWPEVDADRTALCGISFGGYFASRAASREPRIKALVANSPILDLCAYLAAFFPFDPCRIPDEEDFSVADLAHIPDEQFPPQEKVMTENLIRRFGKQRFKEAFLYIREFTVGEAARDIVCPCLAMAGEGEGAEPKRQFDLFCESVSGPVQKAFMQAVDGADSHCQAGNTSLAAAVMLDWLDEVLA
jgi:pimeloyl-ACP methyl ester carboxylesterase